VSPRCRTGICCFSSCGDKPSCSPVGSEYSADPVTWHSVVHFDRPASSTRMCSETVSLHLNAFIFTTHPTERSRTMPRSRTWLSICTSHPAGPTTSTVSCWTTPWNGATPPTRPSSLPRWQRIARRTGRTPRCVAADRGHGEHQVDQALHDLGVPTVVIPRKGRPGRARQTEEHRRAFRTTEITVNSNTGSGRCAGYRPIGPPTW
jgi:hypothetical protein